MNSPQKLDKRHSGQRHAVNGKTMTRTDLKHIYYNEKIIGDLTIIETPETLEPHVEWNSLATKRGIYEGFMCVVGLLRQAKHVIIMTNPKAAGYYDGFASRGILRKVGVILGVQPNDVHIYQAVKQ